MMSEIDQWWKEQVVYQIYPKSFQDSNGDGIGDLQGIIQHLDDLKELGVGVIWLSPIYRSPNVDNGYDISDYRDINPEYGTLDDFKQLVQEAKARSIYIMMDLVMNHTSDEHPWFQASRHENSPYRNYYYWKKANGTKLPNNWTSFFAERCWEYDALSDSYYLHLFDKKQPDLNYHNPMVLEEIKDIMKYWLDMGIAGFRCDVINLIYKNSLENGRKKLILTGSEHYLSSEKSHMILKSIRHDVLNQFRCFTVGETVFVTTKEANHYCHPEREELDMVFAFEHMETDQILVKWFKTKFSVKKFAKVVSKWQKEVPWNANYLENHDQPRSVSRFGNTQKYWNESAKMLATLLFTLKGTPFIYQGQEIGMINYPFKHMKEIRDIESHNVDAFGKRFFIPKFIRMYLMRKTSRDNARTPYQWSNQLHGGFTTHTPWIQVNPNYQLINHQNQRIDDQSVLSYYKKLISLKKSNKTLLYGEFCDEKVIGDVFTFSRKLKHERITVFLNFGKKTHTIHTEGKLLLSNYHKTKFDGLLMPYESVIMVQGQ